MSRFDAHACRAALAALVLFLASAGKGASAQEPVDATRLKAAFLFKISQFIDWPEQAFAGPDAPFLICVPGPGAATAPGSLGEALAPLEQRKHKGRAIVIHRPATLAEARKCQIIYLSHTKLALADGKPLLPQLADAPILTVGDTRDLAANGLGIGFIEQDGKLRLVIDLGLLRPLKLRPSAKLLEIALAVNGL